MKKRMQGPGIARRHFLQAALGALLLPFPAAAAPARIRLLSAASSNGNHYAAALASGGLQTVPVPIRGHGVLVDPRSPGQALVIARRPGSTVTRVDLASGEVLQQWQAAENRHFYGHACYSRDGSTLFVTENNTDTATGVVSVRDAADFSLLEEYPSQGIGPHELLLMPDGATLAVANGGIRTLPETGRVKLNRGRIESSLAYIDIASGKLRARYPVPLPHLSLRHLALAPDGQLAAALQFQGDAGQPGQPLLVFHHGEDRLQLARAPQAAWNRMRNYAASVAFDPTSGRFALTCPRGSTLACWTAGREYAGHIDLPKVSGIAFSAGQGFASNELGEIYRLDLVRLTAILHASHPGLQWDNHLYLAFG